MNKVEMKRRFYLKTVISKFLEEHFGEAIDDRLVALLRSRIESRNSHNGEFEVKLFRGSITVLHLNEEICTLK
jgi:hypothetical protein